MHGGALVCELVKIQNLFLPSLTKAPLTSNLSYLLCAPGIRSFTFNAQKASSAAAASPALIAAEASQTMTVEGSASNGKAGEKGVDADGTTGGRPAHHVPNPGMLLGPKFCNPWETFEERTFGQARP